MGHLIGLGSRARVGKDYAAEQLKNYFIVKRVAFADKLKQDLDPLFKNCGFALHDILSNPTTKEMVRPLLVEYGCTMRKLNPNVWVERALEDQTFDAELTVITDVRFPNEYDALKKYGGIFIDIQSEVPFANETEVLHSPKMRELADYTIYNNFDGKYIQDMVELVLKIKAAHGPAKKN